MKPCIFCGAGEFLYDESNYWTGRRNILLKVRMHHWCQNTGARTYIEEKTKDACIQTWNEMVGKP